MEQYVDEQVQNLSDMTKEGDELGIMDVIRMRCTSGHDSQSLSKLSTETGNVMSGLQWYQMIFFYPFKFFRNVLE